MSTHLAQFNAINVSRYAGPGYAESATRVRWQITNEATGEYVTLSWEQLTGLISWIASTNANEILNGPGLDE